MLTVLRWHPHIGAFAELHAGLNGVPVRELRCVVYICIVTDVLTRLGYGKEQSFSVDRECNATRFADAMRRDLLIAGKNDIHLLQYTLFWYSVVFLYPFSLIFLPLVVGNAHQADRQ
jgi:hypothetical protein